MAEVMTGYTVPGFSAGDTSEVLAVINRDQIAGQPLVTEQMLAEALAGRNDVDSGWWAELSNMVTEVALATDGQVTGAISYTPGVHATTPVSSCGCTPNFGCG